MERPYVDYYAQNEISPISQDISDLSKHLCRRGALYRFLGITPGNVRGRKVLEFGPATGHNPLHTASLKPAKYVLVDANPTAIREIERFFIKHDVSNFSLVLSFIEDYEDNDEYDLVVGEAFLSVQKFPREILDKMASFVRPGGILLVSIQDSVSSLSDFLRNAIGSALRDPNIPLRENAERLIPVFEPHLKILTGMSRPITDWILDHLQPFAFKELFSCGDVIEHLNDSFVFLGSSPNFVTDWRWYKDCLDDRLVNANAMAFQLFKNILHF